MESAFNGFGFVLGLGLVGIEGLELLLGPVTELVVGVAGVLFCGVEMLDVSIDGLVVLEARLVLLQGLVLLTVFGDVLDELKLKAVDDGGLGS